MLIKRLSIFWGISVLVSLLAPVSPCSGTTDTYLNKYDLPVVIKVPYYKTEESKPEFIDITLEPGDLYEGHKGRNGHVYKKYGLMPDIMEKYTGKFEESQNVHKKDIRAALDAEYAGFLEGMSAETMPEDWVNEQKEKYDSYVGLIQRMIEINTNLITTTSDEIMINFLQKKVDKYVSDYISATNIQGRVNDLIAPENDPDNDGINNRTEFYRGSNPWMEDYITAYPRIVKITPDGNTVATGCFYIVNVLQTNITVKLENVLNRTGEPKYFLKFVKEQNSVITNVFNIDACSTNRVYLLVNALNFPKFFYEAYKISVCFTNKCYSEIKLYTPGDYSKKLKKPIDLRPKNGTKFEKLEKLSVCWKDDENDTNENNYVRIEYKPQFISIDHGIYAPTYDVVKKSVSYDIHETPYGISIWRVRKKDAFSNPVNSDWNWFAVGREIAPEKIKGTGSDEASAFGYYGAEVIIATVGKKYDLPIQMHSTSNSHFLKPLLENQEVYFKTNGAADPNCFHVMGVFEKTGVYSNTWLNINKKGETNEHLYVFIVRNSPKDRNVRSFYYLEDKTITHDLFVNVPFEYKERQFFETLSKKEDLIWDDDLKMEFGEVLPEGLTVSRTEDGEDLEIKGVPSTAGTFKIDLAFSNGKRHAKEQHVFRIKDIGEPPFEFEKRLYVPRKKEKLTSSVHSEKKNMVNHYSYVGIDFRYPIYCEANPRYNWTDEYWRFVRDVKIEVIGDPAPGLKVGDIPFCTNFVTNAETTALGFFGKPTQAGVFTNMVVLAEKDLVVTNKHIFSIKQDLD